MGLKMLKSNGILGKNLDDSPIAVIDFETTGLVPGVDRVVEVSVVKKEPGKAVELVFDTLVNPMRPVAATEIHGITDGDVEIAPRFDDIAGDLLSVISECVIVAYNIYFEMKFLNYEFRRVGVDHIPPHFCLMYMRPMLNLGSRCRLEEACRDYEIEYQAAHVASKDAQAAAQLLQYYLRILQDRGMKTFSDLASLKKYKFIESFAYDPLPNSKAFDLKSSNRVLSRSGYEIRTRISPERIALCEYWDELSTVLADLEITEEELEHMSDLKTRLNLKEEQIRVLHARAFSSAIAQFTDDQWLDERESKKLKRLHECLARLGWSPGG
jgi:DNA polymerase-3 subunit epsilon